MTSSSHLQPSAELAAQTSCSKLSKILTRRCLHRMLVIKILRGMTRGRLQMDLAGGERLFFGDPECRHTTAHITVNDPYRFFIEIARYGGVGLGETYTEGLWTTPDIRAVIEWFIINIHANPVLGGSSQRFRSIGFFKFINRFRHLLRPNTINTSRRNIQEHYDLGNDFYKLWLDRTMTYSSARFTASDQSLESAQFAKYEALCQKLRLKHGDHVLEIGCGWGGFSIYAASTYGCRITALTISQAQHDEATQRVLAAGLQDKIEIRMQDYRLVTGTFDKIVSIEMLEAVGDKFLEPYFAKCAEVLAPDGILAVQMITVPDTRYDQLRRGVDWIQKHIFPGSLLLSVGRVNQAINRTGNLVMHSLEDLGASYVRTLNEWHSNFSSRLDEVRSLGYSENFIRKWGYYLKYCEAGFATANISVVQVCWRRPATPLPSLGGS